MKLYSNDFKHNQQMDSKFTCDGKNISPHLKWEDFPNDTKSFALSVLDPDAPSKVWKHWLVCNIPVSTTEFPQNGPIQGDLVENDSGKNKYHGPCPPSGTHRYFFTIYAIDQEKLSGITKRNFKETAKKHSLDSAELIGLYQRK